MIFSAGLAAAGAGLSAEVKGTAADVWSAAIGDRVREWRNRNLVAGLGKTAGFLKEQGVDIKHARALPDGDLYSIFEGMSRCEDEALQSLWAGLLASRMNPEGTVRDITRYTHTLLNPWLRWTLTCFGSSEQERVAKNLLRPSWMEVRLILTGERKMKCRRRLRTWSGWGLLSE